MPVSIAEQERQAVEQFGRAERRMPVNHSVRREALVLAIRLSHSPHTPLKRLAAVNIAKFFKAFPDLEEDAINAIYDLCEDQDQNIRIQGYKTIVQMSREQPGWVERNVDVLVQLLQSDEPGEVAVVKTALIQHLELDSKVTLGVLCDQIVPSDDPVEDEDRAIREHLRGLVVAFLAEEARGPLITQLRRQGDSGAEQERALIDTLLKAVAKFGRKDAAKITRDILVFLPSFDNDDDDDGRSRGNELLRTLLERAASSLKQDLAPGRNPASLEQSRLYLELSDFVCREKGASDPVRLLRFYCTSSLMGKMTLGRLSENARLFFIVHLARALSACARRPPSLESPEFGELASMRRQVVDALTIILRFFVQIAPSDAQSWISCETLLQTCQQRKEQQTNWNIPPPLDAVLVEIVRLAEEKPLPESRRVANLSRSLTRPPSHPLSHIVKPPPSVQPPIPVLNVPTEATFGRQRGGNDGSNVYGERPGARRLSIKGQYDRQRRKRKDTSPHHSTGSGPSTPGSAAEDGPQQPSNMKRLKTTTEEETPSLLLRMGHPQHLSVPARGRKTSKSRSPPAIQSQHSDSSEPPHRARLPHLEHGISIKGAARSHPHSLLERIQGDGT